MDKLENNDRAADETFRGHSGWEAQDSGEAHLSRKARWYLKTGVAVGAL